MTGRELPPWWDLVREGGEQAEALGLRWLDSAEREHIHEGARSLLDDPGLAPVWRQRGLERLERSLPLALGPECVKRFNREVASTALFFDPAEPERVQLSLMASMSPLVWASAPATPDGLRELLDRYGVAGSPPVASFPRTLRVLREIDASVTLDQLERMLCDGASLLDDAVWSNSWNEDPWRDVPASENMLFLSARMREARAEIRDRVPSLGFRSQFTRSVLKVEQHPYGLWVLELRYAPCPDAAGVRWVNEIFGTHLPEDLPADLVGSGLVQGGVTTLADLDEQAARGLLEPFDVAARLALAAGDPATTARLQSWIAEKAGDAAFLGFVANAASSYGDLAAMVDVALTTSDEKLAGDIVANLTPREPPPEPEGDDDEEVEP